LGFHPGSNVLNWWQIEELLVFEQINFQLSLNYSMTVENGICVKAGKK
jgi:hypothetical protein